MQTGISQTRHHSMCLLATSLAFGGEISESFRCRAYGDIDGDTELTLRHRAYTCYTPVGILEQSQAVEPLAQLLRSLASTIP